MTKGKPIYDPRKRRKREKRLQREKNAEVPLRFKKKFGGGAHIDGCEDLLRGWMAREKTTTIIRKGT